MKLLNQSFWSTGKETSYFLKSFIYCAQRRLSLFSGISNSIKFFFLSYFIKYKCPPRFSLTSEQAKNNNFYEIHIYVPHPNTDAHLKSGEDRFVYMSFIPDNVESKFLKLFSGRKKYFESDDLTNGHLSSDYLCFSRIDVNYYRGHWSAREHDCSLLTLFRLYLYKKVGLIHLTIIKEKYLKYRKKRRVKNLTKNAVVNVIKGKFELYSAIMSDDEILSKGQFSEKQLADILFGYDYMVDISTYNLVNNALTWVLEACVQDGELQEINDGKFKITAKGVHYFTITREAVKNKEDINNLTIQQIKVQRSVSILTYLLVLAAIVTALSQAKSACSGYDWLREKLSMDLFGQCSDVLEK